jgi:hypothetical protein
MHNCKTLYFCVPLYFENFVDEGKVKKYAQYYNTHLELEYFSIPGFWTCQIATLTSMKHIMVGCKNANIFRSISTVAKYSAEGHLLNYLKRHSPAHCTAYAKRAPTRPTFVPPNASLHWRTTWSVQLAFGKLKWRRLHTNPINRPRGKSREEQNPQNRPLLNESQTTIPALEILRLERVVESEQLTLCVSLL